MPEACSRDKKDPYSVEKNIPMAVDATDSENNLLSDEIIAVLVSEDHGHAIKLRTMSWQKATWLLAEDQVYLAIMAQSWSLSVLGWVPGIITMLAAGAMS